MITRYTSRKGRLDRIFLKKKLENAISYDRIAGYFRSSVFELIHEEISSIGRVRIVCNSDLNSFDFDAIRTSEQLSQQLQVERWHKFNSIPENNEECSRWRLVHKILTGGNIEIRIVARENAPFLHGKAGLITHPDGSTSSFVGSINETGTGWASSYELIWEDQSKEAAKWVSEEFEWLWGKGEKLSSAVIDEIGRAADRIETELEELKLDPHGLIKSVVVESPLAKQGEKLTRWQKDFVKIFIDHLYQYDAARLLLADEVGLGKTLSMATAGVLSVLMGHGPLLILCPASLIWQWQTELWDKLGIPSCVWNSQPKKGWINHEGYQISPNSSEEIGKCPYQIGIVSTGILIRNQLESNILINSKYGMVILDEAHKARIQRRTNVKKEVPNNLYTAMQKLATQTRHLVIGTATPIQTNQEEIWDLIKLLAHGNDFVLGKSQTSSWWNSKESLDIVTGKKDVHTVEHAWQLIRSPLPPRAEHKIFDFIRDDLKIHDKCFFSDRSIIDLKDFTREELEESIAYKVPGYNISFLRFHNPLGRHAILRRRHTLEQNGEMKRIGVKIHPNNNEKPGIFRENAILTPFFYNRAYQEVEKFTKLLMERKVATGFLKSLIMQRICSSVASGLATVERMLHYRQDIQNWEGDDDPDILELISNKKSENKILTTEREVQILKRVKRVLSQEKNKDPKGAAVMYFLEEKNWKNLGCIIFSQYYDTVNWISNVISTQYQEEPIAVYAGVGKSKILYSGKRHTVTRENIKQGVKDRKFRVVCATDAASEGLNLQALGTIINVDLPWNPSKLEQRLGRIKRYGQLRDEVDMANLVYLNTIDELIYERLSKRMKDRYDVLGSIPDTIQDEWIEDIENYLEELKNYTKPPAPADLFHIRSDSISSEKKIDTNWELWTKVVTKEKIIHELMQPW